MTDDRSSINNSGSNPNGDMRRSGGSANDPHGGHEHIKSEWKGPDPDPISELVPGGQGAEAPPAARGNIAPKTLRVTSSQPGFGPSEFDKPTVGEGLSDEDELPSDGDEAVDPLSGEGRRREGMNEGEVSKP